jgi:hypothetical protein
MITSLIFLTPILLGGSHSELVTRDVETAEEFGNDISQLASTNASKIPVQLGDNGTTQPGFLKRGMSDEDWETLTCAGEHIINIIDAPSYQAAVDYCNHYAPTWAERMASQFENPEYEQTYGWDTVSESSTVRNLHIDRVANALEYYRLSTNPNDWVMRTVRHGRSWTDSASQEHTVRTLSMEQ